MHLLVGFTQLCLRNVVFVPVKFELALRLLDSALVSSLATPEILLHNRSLYKKADRHTVMCLYVHQTY